MNTIIRFTVVLIWACCFVSCSTTEKFWVYGDAGTEVYSPNMNRVAVLDNSGKAKIVVPSDVCYTYMLAKGTNTKDFVPFALDYKKNSHMGAKVLLGLEYTLALGAIVPLAAGTVAAIQGDDGIAGPMLAAGGAAALIGAFGGMVTDARMKQTDHAYQFQYLSNQQANTDVRFSTPIYTEPYKTIQTVETATQKVTPSSATGWKSKKNSNIKLPFKSGTFNVLQVNTHYNGECMKLEPEGTVTIDGSTITINISGNSILEDKSFVLTKDLKNTKRFGEPERTYQLYRTSDGMDIGLYYDGSFASIGVLEQKILLTISKSLSFEISWM